MFRSFLGSAFLIAASVLAAPSAATASLAALYEGKTVTILVGYGIRRQVTLDFLKRNGVDRKSVV